MTSTDVRMLFSWKDRTRHLSNEAIELTALRAAAHSQR